MNTYTLVEGRQKAAMLKAEGKKRLKGIKFFIIDYPNMILGRKFCYLQDLRKMSNHIMSA
ncbi:MAG: hypothetical protein F6K17_30745 [Okeania sp. SIO3C4]|nr:hypothetical protein [Okeania sp. SIO3C4]